jgi:hypothetical protein
MATLAENSHELCNIFLHIIKIYCRLFAEPILTVLVFEANRVCF